MTETLTPAQAQAIEKAAAAIDDKAIAEAAGRAAAAWVAPRYSHNDMLAMLWAQAAYSVAAERLCVAIRSTPFDAEVYRIAKARADKALDILIAKATEINAMNLIARSEAIDIHLAALT